MKKRRFFFLSFCLGYLFSCTPKADADAIPLLTPAEGETISIVSDGVKSYLCLQDAQKEADYLSKWSGTPFCDSQATSFSWKAKASGTYRVRFSTAKDLSNACTYLIEGNTLEEYTAFVPGERYYWQVEMGEMTDGAFVTHQKSKVGTFLVEENSLRPIGIEGAWNVRDIGGWKNEKGERTLNAKKFYTKSRINNLNEAIERMSVEKYGVHYITGEWQGTKDRRSMKELKAGSYELIMKAAEENLEREKMNDRREEENARKEAELKRREAKIKSYMTAQEERIQQTADTAEEPKKSRYEEALERFGM